jgi:DNA end-binding protein Ku
MRAIWKGFVSFGLVNIPVKLYPATESKSVKFHFLHEKCSTPLKYERFCPTCNRVVPWEETVRGYEYEKGKYAILREEDFAKIPLKTTKRVDIVDFVDEEEIESVLYEKSYYLSPEESAVKAYAILLMAMQAMGKVAIAKVAIKEKEHLVVVRPFRDVLVLQTLFYPDEIRSEKEIRELIRGTEPTQEELKLAKQLIDALASKFRPEKYTDQYREALLELIRAKIEGKEPQPPAMLEASKAKDIMEALRASVAVARKKKKA